MHLCLVALNGPDVIVGNISNAYLNTKPYKKCYLKTSDIYLCGLHAVGKKAQISCIWHEVT